MTTLYALIYYSLDEDYIVGHQRTPGKELLSAPLPGARTDWLQRQMAHIPVL